MKKKFVVVCALVSIMLAGCVNITSSHEHTFSNVWSFNETSHWHDSTCGHLDVIKDLGQHTFGVDGKCTICGYEKFVPIQTYRVTFHTLCEDVIDPVIVNEGQLIELPTPIKYDYNFVAWYTNPDFTGSPFDSSLPITQNVDLYAQYTVKQYSIIFELDGGQWPDGSTESYTAVTKCGEVPVPPGVPHKNSNGIGCNFAGWKSSVDDQFGLKVVHEHEGEIKYTATYDEPYHLAYLVNFYDFEGELCYSEVVPHGYTLRNTPTNPAIPSTCKHSCFSHWSVGSAGGAEFDLEQQILEDYEVYPTIKEVNKHTLTVVPYSFNCEYGGTINGRSTSLTYEIYEDSAIFVVPGLYSAKGQLKVDGELIVTAVPTENTTKYEYYFSGWNLPNGRGWYVNETYYLTGDTTINATFGRGLKTYTVTWEVNGEIADSDIWHYGETPSYNGETPYKEGYIFTGWDPEIDSVEGDTTYTAQFREKELDYELVGTSTDGYFKITGPGDFQDDAIVSIPAKIDGMDVKAIATGAFKECENLEFLNILGDSFYQIEDGAFDSCSKLTEITINDTQYKVATGDLLITNSFATNCPNLCAVVFNDSCVVFGITDESSVGSIKYNSEESRYEYTFSSDTSLRKCFVLKEIVEVVAGEIYDPIFTGFECFKGAPYEYIFLPHTYQYIYSTFVDCLNLKTIQLSKDVYSLPDNFAVNCPNLTTIYFDATIAEFNEIGDLTNKFVSCPNLSTIICNDGDIDLTVD